MGLSTKDERERTRRNDTGWHTKKHSETKRKNRDITRKIEAQLKHNEAATRSTETKRERNKAKKKREGDTLGMQRTKQERTRKNTNAHDKARTKEENETDQGITRKKTGQDEKE